MSWRLLTILVLFGGLSVARAEVGDPVVQVTPRTHQGQLYLGLTPLGTTPLSTPVPAGRRLPLTLFRAGFPTVRRELSIQPGGARVWSPLLRAPLHAPQWPADTPAWVDGPCPGAACGLGAAVHFSPMMARTLAVGRALTEAARTLDLRVTLLDKSYREARGDGLETASQQRTDVRVRPGPITVWTQGAHAAARVGGGADQGLAGLGASSRLAPGGPANQATLAALVDALRWHRVRAQGARVRALVRTYGAEYEDGRYLEDDRVIRHTSSGVCGTLEMELQDHQRLIDAPGVQAPALGWAMDRVQLTGPAGQVELRDGVLVEATGQLGALVRGVRNCLAAEAGWPRVRTAPGPVGVTLAEVALPR